MSSEKSEEYQPNEKKSKLDDSIEDVPQVRSKNNSPQSISANTEDALPKDSEASSTDNNMSKSQRKKLAKREKWEQTKKDKRIKERAKYRQKRLEAIASGQPVRTGLSRKALKHNKMDNSENPFTLAVDLDYDDLMIDKDICKCAKQLLWVYTINRKSKSPLHLYYTGLRENGRIHQALLRNDGYQNWDIKIKNEPYFDVFDKDRIVYLTSDSDDVLTDLDPNSVYIIGGLVDHNHHKGLSLDRATEKGFRTARLPLSEHVAIKTRTVLTIVHGNHF